MNRPVIYTPLETRILLMIKKHLEQEFTDRSIEITGGVHIKPKPKKTRTDVIEINTSGISGITITREVVGIVNINYQDEDYDKVEEFTVFINDLFTNAVVKNIVFTPNSQQWKYQIYRASPYLWLGNNGFFIHHK